MFDGICNLESTSAVGKCVCSGFLLVGGSSSINDPLTAQFSAVSDSLVFCGALGEHLLVTHI